MIPQLGDDSRLPAPGDRLEVFEKAIGFEDPAFTHSSRRVMVLGIVILLFRSIHCIFVLIRLWRVVNRWFAAVFIFSALLLAVPLPVPALSPDEILVVANRNAQRSIGLARYYMEKRNIPADRLVAVWTTDKETCTRQAYERKIVPPIRRWLEEHPEAPIRCLVTVYGVPLKVAPPLVPEAERRRALEEPPPRVLPGPTEEASGDERAEESADGRRSRHPPGGKAGAALDSELALIRAGDYPLEGWRPNPFFVGNQDQGADRGRDRVLMVSRLDGPSPVVVRRLVDDSLAAEAEGLKGRAYFDARWPRPDKDRKVRGYGFYDRSIHLAAERADGSGRMPVHLDDTQALFGPGDCPEAALYCGWYRLSRYVDAFAWQPGAVGFHIASGEMATLRNAASQTWCVQMLLRGVVATVGPVAEPYVQAFPVPEIFFGFLVDGYLTLAECYMVSVPFLSWQMVLVGDPLYRPFRKQVSSGDAGDSRKLRR